MPDLETCTKGCTDLAYAPLCSSILLDGGYYYAAAPNPCVLTCQQLVRCLRTQLRQAGRQGGKAGQAGRQGRQ